MEWITGTSPVMTNERYETFHVNPTIHLDSRLRGNDGRNPLKRDLVVELFLEARRAA